MHLSGRARRRWGVLLTLVVIATAGGLAWRRMQERQARRLVEIARTEGLAAFHAGDLEVALRQLSYYYSRRKADIEPLLAFAEARMQIPAPERTHLREAIGLFQRVLLLEPKNMQALERVLELSLRLGRRMDVAETTGKLLAIDPEHPAAMEARLGTLYFGGRFDEAATLAEQLIEMDPDSLEWRSSLLNILTQQNTPPELILERCDLWIAESPEGGRYQMIKARMLSWIDRQEEAREVAQDAVDNAETTPELVRPLVELLDRLSMDHAVTTLLERSKREHPGATWVWEIALQRCWRLELIGQAREVLTAATDALDAPSIDLRRLTVLVHLAEGATDDARVALDDLLVHSASLEPEEASAWRAWIEGVDAAIADDVTPVERRERLDRAIARRPGDPSLHVLVAEAWVAVREPELAIKSLRTARRYDPRWRAPRRAAASLELETGRAEAALAATVAILRETPAASLETWRLLARAWLAADPERRDVGLSNDNGPVDLVALLRSLHQRWPDAVVPLLVEALVARGETSDAGDVMNALLAREDVAPTTWLELARLSERLEIGWEQAILQRARWRGPLSLELAEIGARHAHRSGRTLDGLALIDEACRADPDRVAAGRRLQAAFLAWAEHPGAVEALNTLLDGVETTDDRIEAASTVLGLTAAWDDLELIEHAIEVLEGVVGSETPRVKLARATWLLRSPERARVDLAEAMILTSDVLRQSPQSLAGLSLMAALLLADERPDHQQAIRLLERAVAIYPDRLELYPRLIGLLQRQGDFIAAEPLLTRLGASRAHDGGIERQELRLLRTQGDFERTLLRMSELIDLDSPVTRRIDLALLHERAGRHDDAEQLLQSLLDDHPDDHEVATALADVLGRRGRLEEALAILGHATGGGDDGRDDLVIGAFLLAHGEPEQARVRLERAVDRRPYDAETWVTMARFHIAENAFGRARQAARQGLRIDPDHAVLRAVLAISALNLDPAERFEAIELLGSVADQPDALTETMALFRVIAARGDDPTRGDLAAARDLIRRFPGYMPAWRLAVLITSRAGRREEAIRVATEAAARLPGRAEPAEWAMRLLIDDSRIEAAHDMAYRWRRRRQDRPIEPDVMISSLELELSHPRLAVLQLQSHSERFWQERDRHPERLVVWLGALVHDRRVEQATALMSELVTEDAERWKGFWLGWARTASTEAADAALRVFAESWASDEDALRLTHAWVGVARQTESIEDDAEARRWATRAATDPADRAEALAAIADLDLARRDLIAAEAAYRRVLAIAPSDVQALNNLAWILLSTERFDQAVTMAEKAMELAPDDAVVLDTLVRALLGAGSLDRADTLARAAESGYPEDPLPCVTLGRVLLVEERYDEAAAKLTEAEIRLQRARRSSSSLQQEILEVRSAIRDARGNANGSGSG